MATTVVMPRQGQTVESCLIVEWKVAVGDTVAEGDTLCDVETDKATLEVPSTASGVVLALLYPAGADVPVMEPIAIVGAPGEKVESPAGGVTTQAAPEPEQAVAQPEKTPAPAPSFQAPAPAGEGAPVSPRARALAEKKGVATTGLAGSGPGGRIIERDVAAAAAAMPRLTPVARAMVAEGGFAVPSQGSGPGGRVMSRDLVQAAPAAPSAAPAPVSAAPAVALAEEVTRIPVKGVRRVIAERMLASLQTTAQLTLNASADARALQSLRKRLKESPEVMGLRGITINDLVHLAVIRGLAQHPDLNAHFVTEGEAAILQFRAVHLGFAVDTPRGLLVPVIHNAHTMTLRQLASEAKRLAAAAVEGKSAPDDLAGGTFTVSNLGGLGIENFTPVLNPPQVAILGVSNIQLKPVQQGGDVGFVPHIGLSLTINHQAVDGAPGARFLQTLAAAIADVDLLPLG